MLEMAYGDVVMARTPDFKWCSEKVVKMWIPINSGL
jgi:hypothetical protein